MGGGRGKTRSGLLVQSLGGDHQQVMMHGQTYRLKLCNRSNINYKTCLTNFAIHAQQTSLNRYTI